MSFTSTYEGKWTSCSVFGERGERIQIYDGKFFVDTSSRTNVHKISLQDVEKGKFTKTDVYLFHISMGPASNPNKEVLLLTNNRIMYLMKGVDLFSDSIVVII